MFCSFTVEPKNSGQLTPISDDLRNLYESKATQWARERNRTPIARNVGGARKHKWSPEEDARLESVVATYGSSNWRNVALLLPGRSGKQCRERWLVHMAPDNLNEDWTPQEDVIHVSKQGEFGNHWAKIKAFLPGRSLVSVKNRWNWLCRRDIPNHSAEFEELVMAHHEMAKDEPPKNPFVIGMGVQAFELGLWGDQDFPDFINW
jgi:hypothetical protein